MFYFILFIFVVLLLSKKRVQICLFDTIKFVLYGWLFILLLPNLFILALWAISSTFNTCITYFELNTVPLLPIIYVYVAANGEWNNPRFFRSSLFGGEAVYVFVYKCHPVTCVFIYIFIPQHTRLTKGKSKDGLAYCNKKGLWCPASRCRLTVKRSVNAIMIYWHQLTLRQADRAMWYKPLPCKSYKSYYHANIAILQWIVSSTDGVVLS